MEAINFIKAQFFSQLKEKADIVLDRVPWLNAILPIIVGILYFAYSVINPALTPTNFFHLCLIGFTAIIVLINLFLTCYAEDKLKECKNKNRQLLSNNTELRQKAIDILRVTEELAEDNHRYIEESFRDFCHETLVFGSTPKNTKGVEINSERFTLYFKDRVNNEFLPVFRYSCNPSYNSISRTQYPADQGIISKAWIDSKAYKKYPPFSSDSKKYYAEMRLDKITKKISSKFHMKSCLFYGYRINDKNKSPIAVIIIESTNQNRYSEDNISTIFSNSEFFFNSLVPSLILEYDLLMLGINTLLDKKYEDDIELDALSIMEKNREITERVKSGLIR